MKNYKELIIGNDLKQLLIGSLLGDGSFCSIGKHAKNMYLSIAHSMKQEEYLKFKVSILNRYGLASNILYSVTKNSRYKS